MNKFKVYKITNKLNGMIYIGVTSKNINQYHGSGVSLKEDYKKLGKNNFKKEVLYSFDNSYDMLQKEAELVNKEFVLREDTYNIIPGGGGFNNIGMVPVKDKEKCKLIPVTEFNKGQYDHITKGKVVVKDPLDPNKCIHVTQEEYKTGKWESPLINKVTVKDTITGSYKNITSEEYKTGKFEHASAGLVTVKDPDNIGKFITVTQAQYKLKKYERVMSGMVTVIDPDNNENTIIITKEEFNSGSFQHINAGTSTARVVKTGEIIKVFKDDYRWKTGEIEGNTKGYKWVNNGIERKRIKSTDINVYLQNGYNLGKKLIDCTGK